MNKNLKLCFNCLNEIKEPYYAYFSHFDRVRRKEVCEPGSRKLKNAIECCLICYPYWEKKGVNHE